ncbi:hypothetical protein Tco_0194303 [Tanacetum coccineum]
MTTSCHSLKGSWLSISGRASIEGYYEENIDHMEQTNKLVQANIDSLDKIATDRTNLLKTLNEVTETLKVIQNAVKDDPTLNKKGLKSSMESLQDTALSQENHLAKWAKSSTFMAWNLGLRMLSRVSPSPQAVCHNQHLLSLSGKQMLGGGNVTHVATEEAPSYTKGETEDMETENKEEKPEEPKMEVPVSSIKPVETPTPEAQPITTSQPKSSQAPKKVDKGKRIATDDDESQVKLVLASRVVRENPDEPVRVPYIINGKINCLINDEITKHLEKEELIKKAAKQARLLAISKPKVVKVVHEEAKKIEINPEIITSTKESEKFKKAQDAELKVLNKERYEKLIKVLALRKHKFEKYMWTIRNRHKLKKITNVKIHLHTKPVAVTVYKIIDRLTFEVHNPFSFGAFSITELNEQREIIPKKKNVVVKDLMNSLRRRYKRLKKILKELRIQSALPAPTLEQASSKSSRRNRKHMELEPEVKKSEYGIFFTDVFGDQAFQRWNDIHKLKKLIAEHPDQENLKSKTVKLEALGYKLD